MTRRGSRPTESEPRPFWLVGAASLPRSLASGDAWPEATTSVGSMVVLCRAGGAVSRCGRMNASRKVPKVESDMSHDQDRTILKLETDDAERELAFELAYLRSLTTQQRFELMFRRSREIAEVLLRHGHRKPVEIVKRT